MATFELHHLSLAQRTQPRLFDVSVDKAHWIRVAFGEQFSFGHRGSTFHWVPFSVGNGDEPIVGVIEREYPFQHYEAPEKGGYPTSSDVWQGAVVTIDPRHHSDGQKLAFERGTKIGQPLAVLGSLIGQINDRDDAPYIISISAIWDEGSFQAFAERHGNILRSVTFQFVVPNMFDLSGKLDEKLKQVGEDTGAKHVTLTLESPDGVRADAPEVEAGVAYGSKGQATVTAKAMDGDRYSSTDKVRTSRIAPLLGQGKALLAVVREYANEVLGRGDADSSDTDSDRNSTD